MVVAKFYSEDNVPHEFQDNESMMKYICENWGIQGFQIQVSQQETYYNIDISNKLGETFSRIGWFEIR